MSIEDKLSLASETFIMISQGHSALIVLANFGTTTASVKLTFNWTLLGASNENSAMGKAMSIIVELTRLVVGNQD